MGCRIIVRWGSAGLPLPFVSCCLCSRGRIKFSRLRLGDVHKDRPAQLWMFRVEKPGWDGVELWRLKLSCWWKDLQMWIYSRIRDISSSVSFAPPKPLRSVQTGFTSTTTPFLLVVVGRLLWGFTFVPKTHLNKRWKDVSWQRQLLFVRFHLWVSFLRSYNSAYSPSVLLSNLCCHSRPPWIALLSRSALSCSPDATALLGKGGGYRHIRLVWLWSLAEAKLGEINSPDEPLV